MGKSKPADLNKPVAAKSNKKAKDVIPTEESVEPEVPVTKNKTKQASNINPASKKIQKEAVVPQKPNKEKKAEKQEIKKENKTKAVKEAKEAKQAKEETKEEEEVAQESSGLDVKNFAEISQAQTEKYNRIRRKVMTDVQLDKDQIKEATKALITYHNASKKPNQLLDNNDDFIYVEIVLSEVPDKHSIRPVQVKLPVPIYGPEYQSRFCVFSRDPQRAYKDKIQDLEIPTIAKVIGYKKLVKKFPQYEDKRKLFHDYDLFFCDYKLYNLLREHTGKIFYEGKKIPFPIDCNEVPEHLKEEYKTYQDYLNSLAQCSYFSMGNGPVYTAKVARVSMNLKDTVKNIIHGIYNTVPYIIKENIAHTKVRQISIKTASSISLPIFNQLTEDELKAVVEIEKPVQKKDKKASKKDAKKDATATQKPAVAGNGAQKQAAPQKAVEKATAPQKQAAAPQKPVEKAAAPKKQQAAPQKAAAPQKPVEKAAPQKGAKGAKKGGKMVEE